MLFTFALHNECVLTYINMYETYLVTDFKSFSESLLLNDLTVISSLEQLERHSNISQIQNLIVYKKEPVSYKDLKIIRALKKRFTSLKIIYVLSQQSPSIKTLIDLGVDIPLRSELGFQKLSEVIVDILSTIPASIQSFLPVLKVKDLELNPNTRQVKRGLKMINLRKKEFDLLEFLLFNQGRVVSKSQILEQVWDYNFDVESKTVDVHISSLRSKVDKGFQSPYIHTVYGTGYKLDAVK